MTVLELRSAANDDVLGTVTHADGLLTFTAAAEYVFAQLRTILGNERLWQDLADNGWSNGWLYVAQEGAAAPQPVVVAAARTVWDGCLHGLHPAHEGPCP